MSGHNSAICRVAAIPSVPAIQYPSKQYGSERVLLKSRSLQSAKEFRTVQAKSVANRFEPVTHEFIVFEYSNLDVQCFFIKERN
jgi:hypothetical protein